MCVSFTNLNKVCPKDPFASPPRIHLLIDSTTCHELLSFIDAYSGYKQIKMYKLDMEATLFIIDRGIYCYKVMLFGLKYVGATYQRFVHQIFKKKIREMLEVYLDNLVVKGKE